VSKFQTYSDDSLDALDDIRDLVNDILDNGVYQWPISWTTEELEELKRWLDKQLEDH